MCQSTYAWRGTSMLENLIVNVECHQPTIVNIFFARSSLVCHHSPTINPSSPSMDHFVNHRYPWLTNIERIQAYFEKHCSTERGRGASNLRSEDWFNCILQCQVFRLQRQRLPKVLFLKIGVPQIGQNLFFIVINPPTIFRGFLFWESVEYENVVGGFTSHPPNHFIRPTSGSCQPEIFRPSVVWPYCWVAWGVKKSVQKSKRRFRGGGFAMVGKVGSNKKSDEMGVSYKRPPPKWLVYCLKCLILPDLGVPYFKKRNKSLVIIEYHGLWWFMIVCDDYLMIVNDDCLGSNLLTKPFHHTYVFANGSTGHVKSPTPRHVRLAGITKTYVLGSDELGEPATSSRAWIAMHQTRHSFAVRNLDWWNVGEGK